MFGIITRVIVLTTFQIAFVRADYQCLCNYNAELPVYPHGSSASQSFGYLYEFDCKPVYAKPVKDSGFYQIMFEKKVGNVENGNGIKIQTCEGIIPTDDLIPSKPLTPRTSTTTYSSSTSTTLPSTTRSTTIPPSATSSITTQPSTTRSTSMTPATTSSTTTLPSTTHSTTIPPSATSSFTTPPSTTRSTKTSTSTTTLSTTPPSTKRSTTIIPSTRYAITTPPSTTSTVKSTTTKPTTAVHTAAIASCPNGWNMHDTSCYLFHTSSQKHWDDANNDCVNKHSHLAIIETAEEFTFIKHQLTHLIDTGSHDISSTSAWVAGRDHNNEGTWEWYDGLTNTYKPFTYTHWGKNEPDSGDGDHEEDCMAMIGHHDFKWADYSCSKSMLYVCEQSALTLISTHTQNPPKQEHGAYCPSDWIQYHGSCYFFHMNSHYTWNDADAYCSRRKAHLAIIESAHEDTFLKQESSKRVPADTHGPGSGVWVAGSDDDSEGRWEWLDGFSKTSKPMEGYSNWYPGEPDSGDGDHDEDCMSLIGDEGFHWEDYKCDKRMFFICEKPVMHAVPLVG